MYISYIRSILEYAAPVWNPCMSHTRVNKLQVLQNTGLSIVLGVPRSTRIDRLHLKPTYHLSMSAMTLQLPTKLKSIAIIHPMIPFIKQPIKPFLLPDWNVPTGNTALMKSLLLRASTTLDKMLIAYVHHIFIHWDHNSQYISFPCFHRGKQQDHITFTLCPLSLACTNAIHLISNLNSLKLLFPINASILTSPFGLMGVSLTMDMPVLHAFPFQLMMVTPVNASILTQSLQF